MTVSYPQKLSLSLAPFCTNPEGGGAEWRLDSTRQIIRASADNAYIYVPIFLAPGSIIMSAKIRWGGGGTGDGIYANVQRREGEGTNKYFDDLTSVETFTRGAADPEQQTSNMGGFPITIEDGWSYVFHFTSQVVSQWADIYDLVIQTRLRTL
jgi:hypothetical protein